ncbi:hypothetical protein [Aeromicrobium sp. Leaf350]|uniref:hypothetical protein n=1 Tax=Aeromicrobium sp. Leaf350 TaxID=2876565 RepID=UPI001E384BBA|nr:hypothetical protein [Aeromicrobium sp. Leaf350]
MARHVDHAADPTPEHPADRSDGTGHDHARDHTATVVGEERARDKFGGLNIGSAFFGWIVAIGVAVLLAGIVGAVLAGLDSTIEVTQSEAERAAGTIGLSTAIVLLVMLAIAYYAGGYVAGRMSRFDGVRQGIGVWVIGLVVTLVAIGLGAAFGSRYNVLERVDLPRIPISTDELTGGAVIAGIAVVLVTLVFAALGGAVGQRYHHRVDRVARR